MPLRRPILKRRRQAPRRLTIRPTEVPRDISKRHPQSLTLETLCVLLAGAVEKGARVPAIPGAKPVLLVPRRRCECGDERDPDFRWEPPGRSSDEGPAAYAVSDPAGVVADQSPSGLPCGSQGAARGIVFEWQLPEVRAGAPGGAGCRPPNLRHAFGRQESGASAEFGGAERKQRVGSCSRRGSRSRGTKKAALARGPMSGQRRRAGTSYTALRTGLSGLGISLRRRRWRSGSCFAEYGEAVPEPGDRGTGLTGNPRHSEIHG